MYTNIVLNLQILCSTSTRSQAVARIADRTASQQTLGLLCITALKTRRVLLGRNNFPAMGAAESTYQ